eukprot:scaffold82142_cov43-Cyclotella_meneghiniana.AAC.4
MPRFYLFRVGIMVYRTVSDLDTVTSHSKVDPPYPKVYPQIFGQAKVESVPPYVGNIATYRFLMNMNDIAIGVHFEGGLSKLRCLIEQTNEQKILKLSKS